MTKRYVEVPADRLVSELETIGNAVAAKGGHWTWEVQGRERVFEVRPPKGGGTIRVYTSLAVGDATARACGEDAVRVVVGAQGSKFRPLSKGVKILRTAPRGAQDRVGTFLGRLRDQIRSAYGDAMRVETCHLCGSGMRHRDGRNGSFLGCVEYPKCTGTRSLKATG